MVTVTVFPFAVSEYRSTVAAWPRRWDGRDRLGSGGLAEGAVGERDNLTNGSVLRLEVGERAQYPRAQTQICQLLSEWIL